MKYYTTTTEFNCGIDLHSRQMYVCVMDRTGKLLLHTNVQGNDFGYFLRRVEPWRKDLTVTCECTFNPRLSGQPQGVPEKFLDRGAPRSAPLRSARVSGGPCAPAANAAVSCRVPMGVWPGCRSVADGPRGT